jgi:hypothetical protein
MEDRPMADAEPQQSQEEREQQENENLFEINEAKITVVCGDCLPFISRRFQCCL